MGTSYRINDRGWVYIWYLGLVMTDKTIEFLKFDLLGFLRLIEVTEFEMKLWDETKERPMPGVKKRLEILRFHIKELEKKKG